MRFEQGSARALGDLLETPIAEVAKDLARHFEAVIGNRFFDFGIYRPVDFQQVEPAVVVEIGESRAPTHEARLDGQSCGSGYIVKKFPLHVVAENGCVVAEVRGKDIEKPVAVVV